MTDIYIIIFGLAGAFIGYMTGLREGYYRGYIAAEQKFKRRS